MRIALYHLCPPGGALRMLQELARRSHHETEVFTIDLETGGEPPQGDCVYRLSRSVSARLPGPARILDQLRRVVALEARIARDIDSRGFDAVLVHPSQITQAPTLPSLLRRTPSVLFVQEPRRRNYEVSYARRSPAKGFSGLPRTAVTAGYDHMVGRLDRRSVAAATELVCNSWFSAESIYRAYGRVARRCPAGVDPDLFHPVPSERRRAVVAVGGLEAFKAHHEVVEALGLIPRERRPELDIVFERCDDEYRRRLQSQASAMGVTLNLHHRIDDKDLVNLYSSAQATVCAAHLEPFGLTSLESLACGTPVVAVCEGGFREVVISPEDGVTVERQPAALSRAIDDVCAGRVPGTAEGRHQRVRALWSWEHSAGVLDDIVAAAAISGRGR